MYKIIDLRDKEMFMKEHYPNSVNISFTELLLNPEKYLEKNQEYLIVCQHGIKSKKTSNILNNMGYHTKGAKYH